MFILFHLGNRTLQISFGNYYGVNNSHRTYSQCADTELVFLA